jgi:broad specificity phosphatase PhoE
MRHSWLLARHGETEWNRQGRMQGRDDSPLTSRGYAHARDLAEFVSTLGIGGILASPIGRAQKTAEIVAGWIGCGVELREELEEIDFGKCSGLTPAESHQAFPGLEEARRRDRWRHRWPGGESYADALIRLEPLISDLLARKPAMGPTLIIAHQSINRVLLHALGRIPADQAIANEQPSGCVLGIDGEGRVLHATLPEAGEDRTIVWRPGLYDRRAACMAAV